MDLFTQKSKLFWSYITFFVIVFSMLVIPISVKANTVTTTENGFTSSNYLDQSYNTWGTPLNSYLVENSDGTISRIENTNNNILIETYNSDYKLQSSTNVAMELTLFGGYFSGVTYNYLVFGQENKNEDNSVEVYRIVQYTKDWQRVGSAGLYGANTYIPFAAGSCRMCEYNGMLYVRTCHTMYTTSDGLHHQANVTISYNESNQTITDSYTRIMNVGYGYVSHSFNQFIKTTGSTLVAVDHGDAYPRSIVLLKYANAAGNNTFTGKCDNINLYSFPGSVGENHTGASVGGFEVSPSNYMVAFNSINQDANYSINNVRNVYVSSVPLNNFSSTAVMNTKITNFTEDGLYTASTPQFVKIPNNQYMMLWDLGSRTSTTTDFSYNGTVQYVILNADATLASSIMSIHGSLSDCQPIVYKNKVVWYTTDNSCPVFYALKTDGTAEDRATVGSTYVVHNITYMVTASSDTNSTVQVIGIQPSLTSVAIPSTIIIDAYSFDVTSIADSAMAGCNQLTKVTIPSNITAIGANVLSGCNALQKVINHSTSPISLPILSKDGYKFLGWKSSTDGSVFISSIASGTANVSFTSTKYTATFNSNGGSVVKSQSVFKGDCVTEPSAPTYKGYTFSGWYTSKTGNTKWDFIHNSVTKNITLYAHWKKNATIAVGKVKIKSAKRTSKTKIKIKWSSVKNATKYQVVYSTSKTFASNVKKVTTSSTSLTLKNLKKKTYYIKIRAYRVKSSRKTYGSYSAKKTVKKK